MGHNRVFWCYDPLNHLPNHSELWCNLYVSLCTEDTVRSTEQSYTSIIVRVPGTQMILELVQQTGALLKSFVSQLSIS